MSYQVTGQIINIYVKAGYEYKKTGEVGEDKHRIQMLLPIKLENGGTRFDPVEIGTNKPELYKDRIGKTVTLPITIGSWMMNGKHGTFCSAIDV